MLALGQGDMVALGSGREVAYGLVVFGEVEFPARCGRIGVLRESPCFRHF